MGEFPKKYFSRNSNPIFFYLVVFLMPFGIYSIKLDGGIDLSISSFLSIILLFLFIITSLVKGSLPNFSLLGVLFLTYILVAMIGSLYADNQIATLRGIAAYIKMFIYFILTIVFIRSYQDVNKCINIIIISCLLCAIMGWIQLIGFYFFNQVIFPPFSEYTGSKLTTKAWGFTAHGGIGAFSIPGFMRMFGFTNPGANQFGASMLIPCSFSLYLALKNKRMRILKWLLFLFFFVTIFVSASRNAILGLFVFLISIYFLSMLMKGNLYRFMSRVFVVTALFFSLTGFLYFAKDSNLFNNYRIKIDSNISIYTSSYLLNRFNPFSSNSISKTVTYFSDYLEIAILHSSDNAGFGQGLQNFDDFAYHNYPVIGYSSHSNFITFLGDTGIWGFLIQVLIVLVTIKYGLLGFKNRFYYYEDLSLYFTSLFLALVVIGIIRTYYLTPFTFMIIGLIVKLYLINCQQRSLVKIEDTYINSWHLS